MVNASSLVLLMIGVFSRSSYLHSFLLTSPQYLQRSRRACLTPCADPTFRLIGGRQHHDFVSSTTNSNDIQQKQPLFTWPRLKELFRNPIPSGFTQKENYIPSTHRNLALFRRSIPAQIAYEEHRQYLAKNWKTPYDYMVVKKFGEDFGFKKVSVVSSSSDDESSHDSIDDGGTFEQIEDENPSLPHRLMYRSSTSLSAASKYTIENKIAYLSLVLNEFPYDVDDGIEHWCLWKIGGTSSAEGIVQEELVWAIKELKCIKPDESSGSWCIYRGGADGVPTSIDEVNVLYTRKFGEMERPRPILDTFYWVNPPHLQSMPEIHHAHILVLRSDDDGDDYF